MEDFELKMMKLFRQFKLGNSLFMGERNIDNSIIDVLQDNVDKKVKHDLVENLSSFIYNKHNSSIVKEINHERNFTQYKIELLVLKMEDFKTIIEATIQMISIEDIEKIKNGETLWK